MAPVMKLRTKILSLPAVATTGFALVVVVNVFWAQNMSNPLLEDGHTFFEALEQNRQLHQVMMEMAHRFQEAVAANDEALLAPAETDRKTFLRVLNEARNNPMQNSAELGELERLFRQYFATAMASSRATIQGEPMDGSNSARAGNMRQLQQQLKKRLAKARRRAEATLADGAAEMRTVTSWSTRTNVVIASTCVLVLVVLSLLIVRGTVRVLDDAVNRLSAAGAQILALAKQTETNSNDEAAAVNETRRTMEALVAAAEEIADSVDAVQGRAERSSEASILIGERISRLNEQAIKVSEISETIQGIADKSDILALNASLEGTKAGESGRGFVLVGEEMRRLAETVLHAAKEIRQLAGQMRELSQAAVVAAEEGQKLSQETTESSKRITHITAQQRGGTEQVSFSMTELQQFTQQALTGAREARSTAADLVSSANDLRVLLDGGARQQEASSTDA